MRDLEFQARLRPYTSSMSSENYGSVMSYISTLLILDQLDASLRLEYHQADVCKASKHKSLKDMTYTDLSVKMDIIYVADTIELSIGDETRLLKSRK